MKYICVEELGPGHYRARYITDNKYLGNGEDVSKKRTLRLPREDAASLSYLMAMGCPLMSTRRHRLSPFQEEK